jgi:NAD(P) transhydrogenase
MAPEPNTFGVDLKDEVVRGSIVTYHGETVPTAPRPSPSPPPQPARPVNPLADSKAPEVLAITPWQKTTREVATVTGGMGLALALGKATGPIFMSNVFTFALAGLIGYRTVWGVVPALHSPLMSVTNAISGVYHYQF